MKANLKTHLLLPAILFFISSNILAQTDAETAKQKAIEAIKLVDAGNYDDGIKLLKEAQQLDPGNIVYPYEIAYVLYSTKFYDQAKDILADLVKRDDAEKEVFQLLGNCYDVLGESEKALETYSEGLKKFPNAGNLYLESGVVMMSKKDYKKALEYFETGIKRDPGFSSNYYWAATLYFETKDELWGMIYGEIFMNLERNTKRTEAMSNLLYDEYASEIKFDGDQASVSFSHNTIDVNDPDLDNFEITYEMILVLSLLGQKKIDINSIAEIRENFLLIYYEKGYDKKFPNALFAYQKKIYEAGFFNEYSHWIVMKGNEKEFDKWLEKNGDNWDKFMEWFGPNKIILNQDNRFYRQQYK